MLTPETFRDYHGQFFNKQITKTVGLSLFAVVLNADESAGISRVAQLHRLDAVEFDRDGVLNAGDHKSIPPVAVECVGNFWRFECGF